MCSFVFMKISKLFHWLYASVMLLPLVVAPIFAIYMHRHNVTNYEVETGGWNVNGLYQTNEVINRDEYDLIEGNIYFAENFSFTSEIGAHMVANDSIEIHVFKCDSFSIEDGASDIDDWYIDSYDASVDNYISLVAYTDGSNNVYGSFSYGNPMAYTSYVFESYFDIHINNCVFVVDSGIDYFISYWQGVFDTTISSTDFNIYSYEYNEGLTYNDTDIGSQFVYSLYLPLNKYFNVTQFLGLNNLYSWINNNAFNGVAPLGFNIFYILLSYWLMVSIFWLVFDVVMYVPNLAHRWLDKGSLQ